MGPQPDACLWCAIAVAYADQEPTCLTQWETSLRDPAVPTVN